MYVRTGIAVGPSELWANHQSSRTRGGTTTARVDKAVWGYRGNKAVGTNWTREGIFKGADSYL